MRPNGAEELLDELPGELRRQLAALAKSREQAVDASSYDAALGRARDRAVRLERELEDDFSHPHDIQALLRLDASDREAAVLGDRSFHGPVAVMRLLSASDSFRGDDPVEAEGLARLALRLIEVIETEHPPALIADLKARGHGHRGNALRIFAHLPGADEALVEARRHFEDGSGDLLLAAQLDAWEGGLRRDQRRFPEAIELQRRSCKRLRTIGDEARLTEILISLAYTYRAAAEYETGLEVLHRVESMLRPGDPLWLYVRHNQISILLDLGRADEAGELLRDARPMYSTVPGSLVQLRVRAMEGRLALAQGHLHEAVEILEAVRREFLDRDMGYDAAVVALETAEAYVRQDRHQELKELAADMISVFQSHDIERETYAAMILFQNAAQAEQATLELIHRMATQLRRRSPVHADLDNEPY